MERALYTKGPWVIEAIDDEEANIMSGKLHIAKTDGGLQTYYDHGNAHLISAAPDMYESLDEMIHAIEYLAKKAPYLSDLHALARAKEAIAKAEGKS